MTNPPSRYRAMSVDEILDSLAIEIYRQPLLNVREDLRSVPEVLRIPILVIDFDTEVQMQGILGFLENSTGLYLSDTIDVFETIAAHDTAKTLRVIHRIMSDHGVTVEQLRTNIADMPEFAISSFRQRHGEQVSQMAKLIVQEARTLYIYDGAERVFDLLSAYLAPRKDELVASLEASWGTA